MALFGSVAVAIVALITFRDDLRARLRQTRPAGVPLLTEPIMIMPLPKVSWACITTPSGLA